MKQFYLLFTLSIFVIACKGPNKKEMELHERVAKGNITLGGTLHLNESEQYKSLYPYSITDVVSGRIASQIYEGLVKIDNKTLQVKPALATNWTIDSSSTIYTFHLKKGVRFHDNQCFPNSIGREVNAHDVKYSFELLATASPDNLNYTDLLKDMVVGADAYYEKSKAGTPVGDVEGFKVLDNYTFQIHLISPSYSFLSRLAMPGFFIIPKEAVKRYGNMATVGTGPFMFNEHLNNETNVMLTRNLNYYETDSLGNQLPYLDTVQISFIPTNIEELEAFQAGKLDVIYNLPTSILEDLYENNFQDFKGGKNAKIITNRVPEMQTNYYEFNVTKAPFNDIRVRQAINYAIDRQKIVDEVLHGTAFGVGTGGICPGTFKGYDNNDIKGYSFNPEVAKKLLADAGFPNGKGFPVLNIKINSGGSMNMQVVVEIQNQLKQHLNIDVTFDIVALKDKLSEAQLGHTEVVRAAWNADFPSPESFLSMFYGKPVPNQPDVPSYPNTTRYQNPAFDELYLKGKYAKTPEEAYPYFLQAEQLMMNDAPVIVLWYNENNPLVKGFVKNLYNNPMNYRDLSQVYLAKDLIATK